MDFVLSLEDFSLEKVAKLRDEIVETELKQNKYVSLSNQGKHEAENELAVEVVLLAIELLMALLSRNLSAPDLFRNEAGNRKLPAFVTKSNIVAVVAKLQENLTEKLNENTTDLIEDDSFGLTKDLQTISVANNSIDVDVSSYSNPSFSVPLSPILASSKFDYKAEILTPPVKRRTRSQLSKSKRMTISPQRPRSAPKRHGHRQSHSPSKLYHYSVSSELDWKNQLRSSSTPRGHKSRSRIRSKSVPTRQTRRTRLSAMSPRNVEKNISVLQKTEVAKNWR